MPKVFLSDAIGEERLIHRSQPAPGGPAFQGWKALSAFYAASLTACGYQVERVARPEIYLTGRARQALGVARGDWHLAVKPIEQLRPFHGIPNVFVCDWPFPEISASPLGGSPFFDQRRVLGMADAVLCCTDFTATTLHTAGLQRVITMPPCIPRAVRGDAKASAATDGREEQIFLYREGADHRAEERGVVVEAFIQARRAGLPLVVSLHSDDAQVSADLERRLEQGCVPVVRHEPGLPDDASFAVFASAASGLSLPLVAAMRADVPLVTTRNSGSASFLPPDAAVRIPTPDATLDNCDEPIGHFMSLTRHAPTVQGVYDAILAAADLDGATRSRMVAAAQESAERRFGFAAFRTALTRLGAYVPSRP